MLSDTIIREMEPYKKELIHQLYGGPTGFALELCEEPGEILITLLMKQSEIEEEVRRAVHKILGEDVHAYEIDAKGNFVWFALKRE